MSSNPVTSFSILQEGNFIKIHGGMSAEIAFGKYFANTVNLIYNGWTNQVVDVALNVNMIADTLNMINNIILDIEGKQITKNTFIVSPGVLSVPYIIDLLNAIYAPSHLLVSLRSMEALTAALDRAKSQGIDCYAIVGYDVVCPDYLVAWIKFRSIPPMYQDIVHKLRCTNAVVMGVWDPKGVNIGETINRAYSLHEDVFFTYVNQAYGRMEQDDIIFKHFLGTTIVSSILPLKIDHLGDWESSIDYITDFLLPLDTLPLDTLGFSAHGQALDLQLQLQLHHPIVQSTHRIRKCCFYTDSTVNLYKFSSELAALFMLRNNIAKKGVVLNPYIISNPLFEVNSGYLPVVYWQFNEDNKYIYADYIKDLASKEIWINLVTETSVCNLLPEGLSPTHVLVEHQVGPWISANPREFKKPRFLNIVDLMTIAPGIKVKTLCF